VPVSLVFRMYPAHCANRCPASHGVLVQKIRIKQLYLGDDFDFSTETEPVKVDPGLALIKARRKEMKRMKQKFKAMDKDGNMLCDMKEFTKLVSGKDGLFPKMTTIEIKKLFEEIDTTKSGTIWPISFTNAERGLKNINPSGTRGTFQIY